MSEVSSTRLYLGNLPRNGMQVFINPSSWSWLGYCPLIQCLLPRSWMFFGASIFSMYLFADTKEEDVSRLQDTTREK